MINHALTFNYLLGFICVNLLDHLELSLDFLASSLYKKDRPLLYRESGPLPYKKDLVKTDINIPRVRSGRVQSAVSFTTLLIASPVAFFYKASFALSLPGGKGADL